MLQSLVFPKWNQVLRGTDCVNSGRECISVFTEIFVSHYLSVCDCACESLCVRTLSCFLFILFVHVQVKERETERGCLCMLKGFHWAAPGFLFRPIRCYVSYNSFYDVILGSIHHFLSA